MEAAGVTRLAPLTLTNQFRSLAGTQVTGSALSHRFGCQVLLELAHRWSDSPPAGKWTIAWTAQGLLRSRGGQRLGRGVQRLAQQVQPDEVYYVGRVVPSRAPDGSPEPREPIWYPDSKLGAGPVVLSVEGEVPALAQAEGIQRINGAGRDPTRGFSGAKQRHILSIPVQYPDTPAEIIDTRDLDALIELIVLLAKEAG